MKIYLRERRRLSEEIIAAIQRREMDAAMEDLEASGVCVLAMSDTGQYQHEELNEETVEKLRQVVVYNQVYSSDL